MKSLIEAFPNHITEAKAIVDNYTFKKPENTINNVIMCGLGGSGIGAKLVATWIADQIKVPVAVSNEYQLPAYANKNTLVICSSYSGNTEETIASIGDAQARGCHIMAISSGGQLKAICEENNYDCVIVPGGNPPRSTLAYSLVILVQMFADLGLIDPSNVDNLQATSTLLTDNQTEIRATGEDIAKFLYGKVGVLYSETKYEGVTIRARQQFNENSKFLCWQHTIPEMNHNELVGWGGGDERFAPIFLCTGDLNPRNQKRMDITREIVERKTGPAFCLEAKGENFIARSMYLINVLDWASFYLCEMNGADIMDIISIDYLKGQLANF